MHGCYHSAVRWWDHRPPRLCPGRDTRTSLSSADTTYLLNSTPHACETLIPVYVSLNLWAFAYDVPSTWTAYLFTLALGNPTFLQVQLNCHCEPGSPSLQDSPSLWIIYQLSYRGSPSEIVDLLFTLLGLSSLYLLIIKVQFSSSIPTLGQSCCLLAFSSWGPPLKFLLNKELPMNYNNHNTYPKVRRFTNLKKQSWFTKTWKAFVGYSQFPYLPNTI